MSEAADTSLVPHHIGIIMDGNRRWAKARGLPTLRGHAKGQQTLRTIAHRTFESGVRYLSVYAFSTENWQRSQDEVGYLMRHVSLALRKYLQEFIDGGVKVVFLGSRNGLEAAVIKAIDNAEAKTAHNDKATLAVCLNYGGQQEIVDATKALIGQGMAADIITPEVFAKYLYKPEVPPIDLLIRTSGDQRLSNFMLWRAAYSELMFTDTYWPDFSAKELDTMLSAYAERQRRFGK